MKRFLSFCVALVLCGQTVLAAEPNVAAQGAALIDGETGRLLWGKNAESPMEMASTTKIMTAILVLEKADPKEVVTISANAAKQPDVQMGLKEGEQWYVGDLLRAMMLKSYNDAAVALAEHVSGSVEAFCMEMTAKAASIGATDTVFGSPNGLDSHLTREQHHSTPLDMGIITAYALQNPVFREIAVLPSHTFADVSGKKVHTAVNTDRFLQMYAGALGVKTGYTNKAGHCFVGAAEQEDMTLVSVVLASGWGNTGKEAKWTDTKKLMDYGFATYEKQEIAEAGETMGEIMVTRSPVKEITAGLGEGYSGVFSEDEVSRLQWQAELPETLEAPIEQGEQIGTATLELDGETIAEIPLTAKTAAPAYTLSQQYRRLLSVWFDWIEFLPEV